MKRGTRRKQQTPSPTRARSVQVQESRDSLLEAFVVEGVGVEGQWNSLGALQLLVDQVV